MGLSDLLFGGTSEVYTPEMKRRHEYGDFLGKQALGRVGNFYLPQMMQQIQSGTQGALGALTGQEAYFSSMMGDQLQKSMAGTQANLASRGLSTGAATGLQEQMMRQMADQAKGFSAQLGGQRAQIMQAGAGMGVGALGQAMSAEQSATQGLMNWQTQIMPQLQQSGGILGPLMGLAGAAFGSGDFFSSLFGGGDPSTPTQTPTQAAGNALLDQLEAEAG